MISNYGRSVKKHKQAKEKLVKIKQFLDEA